MNKHVWIEADKDMHFVQRNIISEKFFEQTVSSDQADPSCNIGRY
jgi:hypothetical protein